MMNKFDLPVYQITIDDFEEAGIDLISFVSNPAILVKGLAFADETKKLPLELKFNEEQQIVAGAVLIPDLPIYRYDEEFGEYFVTFSKETIRKMVERLKQNQKKDLFNVDHTDKMAPAYLLGSWIIESEEYDKSRMYGFDELPIGTFFCEVKVTDKDFWEKEIKKNGKYGFSIEGMMGLKLSSLLNKTTEQTEIVNKTTNNNINTKNNMKRKFKFTDYITKENVKISIDGELAVGSSVFIVAEDGSMEQAEAGDITLEDGTLLVINEEGMIAEIKEVEVAEEIEASKDKEEKEVKEEVKMQVSEEEIMVIMNPVLDEMRKIMAEMQSRIEMLEGNMPKEDEMAKSDNLSFSDEMKFKFNNLRRILD